jgi:uncharacterized membrane protein YbhN (UPF0104 family)
VKGHFAGLMANLCLPGGASGDIVRAGFVMRESQSKSRIAVGSVVDRLLDTFGLFALSCGGAVFALDSQKWLGGPLPKIGLLFLAGVTGIVLFPFIARRMSGISVVSKVMDAVDGYRQAPGKLALCLLMSLAVQSAFIGCNIALAAASGIHVPTAAWFFAWPLAKLFAMLPISMGGLGVREASLAALLSGFGAPAAKVVGVGLVWQTVLITSGLLGGATVFLSTKALESKATPKPFPRVEGADS